MWNFVLLLVAIAFETTATGLLKMSEGMTMRHTGESYTRGGQNVRRKV
jgi:multidrug transporter EmrE-like cation transporter